MTNLKASNPIEEEILNYVNENASDVLTEKINNGKKTIKGCVKFITNEAAKQNKINNCVMMSGREVYGLAMHYFEEDSITENESVSSAIAAVIKPKTDNVIEHPKKKEAAAPKNKSEKKRTEPNDQISGQMSFASLFGGAL